MVREHPAIYDKSHPDHFRVNLRNEIWDEIGKILDVPGKPFIFYLGWGGWHLFDFQLNLCISDNVREKQVAFQVMFVPKNGRIWLIHLDVK